MISSALAATSAAPAAPTAGVGEAFAWNMGLVILLVVMFWFIMIRPQQRRLQEHHEALNALKKGDKVITGGGLLGTVDKVDGDYIIVDLGGGQKVTALKSTLTGKADQESKLLTPLKEDKVEKAPKEPAKKAPKKPANKAEDDAK